MAFNILVTHFGSLVVHSYVLEKTDLEGAREKHLEFGPPPTQLQYPHWASTFWHPSTDGRHHNKYCKHHRHSGADSPGSLCYCIHCAHEGIPALTLGQRSFSFQSGTINPETHNWGKQWEWMTAESLAPNETSIFYPLRLRNHFGRWDRKCVRRTECRRALWNTVFWICYGHCNHEHAAILDTCKRAAWIKTWK